MISKKSEHLDHVRDSAGSYNVISADELPENHPVECFRQVYEKFAGSDGLLDRGDFDPPLYPQLLPWVQLFEIHPNLRYRSRLMGTGVVEMLGSDFTGWYLDEYVEEEMLKQRRREVEDAMAVGRPQYSMSTVQAKRAIDWRVFRGVFPGRTGSLGLIFLILAPFNIRI